jgi:cytochrome c6
MVVACSMVTQTAAGGSGSRIAAGKTRERWISAMKVSISALKKTVAAAAMVSTMALLILFQTSSQAMVSSSEDGASLYKAKCAMCHAADGSASTPVGKSLKIRDLRSAEVQSQTDDQLFGIVASGKGKMPGFEKSLGADACKALIAHIRTFKQ